MFRSRVLAVILVLLPIVLAGCMPSGSGLPPIFVTVPPASQADDAAGYCKQSGGIVETRYPYYDVSSVNPLRLSGSRDFCIFTAPDESRIFVAVDTLYTDQPTLAAMAYQSMTPLRSGASPSANPSSIYCSQLGGTDLFGGVSAATGGWAREGATDAIAMCIFPDLSTIDSWGLTYHSNGIIRGADLSQFLRYKPAN